MKTNTLAPIPLEPSTDIEGTVQPHRLCRQCTRISKNSHALRRKPGAATNGRKEYVDTFRHHESSVELNMIKLINYTLVLLLLLL